MKNTTIYTLAHPITGEIRYVGKTIQKLGYRLDNHLSEAENCNNKKCNWFKKLKRLSLRPIIEELDSSESFEEGCKLEIMYIGLFKSWNFRLINATTGGDGVRGYSHTDKQKQAMSLRRKGKNIGKDNPFYGRKHSEKSKLIIGQKAKGRKHSEKFKQMMSNLHKGWKPTEDMIQSMKVRWCKKVIQLRNDGSYVNLFNSIKEAADKTGSKSNKITLCCQGKRKTHNNFKWILEKDYKL